MCSSAVRCVVVLVLSVQVLSLEYTLTGKNEGEECHKERDQVWVCKKDTECEGLKDILKLNGRIKTCSWKGRNTHVVCCPPKKPLERIKQSKSEDKCSEYEKLLCTDETFILASQAQPAMSLARAKREDVTEPDLETTTFEPFPVLGIHGGLLAKGGEFPSMERQKREDFHITVFGGTRAPPRKHPHMALIGYGEADAISWQCGGSLVSETFVLSAAHCINTPYGLARWVKLGDLDLKSDTDEALPQQFEVVERVVHPGYKAPAFYNDLALLRLGRAATLDRFVRPACLYPDLRDLTGFGTAAGWGKNESNGPKSSSLMQVDISFVPSTDCKRLVGNVNKYLPKGIDTKTMICAGELGKDTCQGDSGGPLILSASRLAKNQCLARLVGVTSFGPKNCGQTSVPGAYVRVAQFHSWIESIVWPE